MDSIHYSRAAAANVQPADQRPGNFELFSLLKIILKNPKKDRNWLQRQTEMDLEPHLKLLQNARLIRVHPQASTSEQEKTPPSYSITKTGVAELANFMFPGPGR